MGKVVFSSDELPPGLSSQQRFLAWREFYNENVGRADLLASEAPFHARMEFVQASDILLGHSSVTVGLSEYWRTAGALERQGRLGLVINRSAGPIHAIHRRHEESIGPGGFMLLSRVDHGRFLPTQFRTDWVVIDLPEAAVVRLAPKAQDLVGTRLRAGGEPLKMISSYAGMVLGQESIGDPRVEAHVSQTLIDLVGLALGAERDAATIATGRGLRAARLEAVLREIAAGYANPAFSIGMVAAKLGLSHRYIQDLLQSTGSGFSERVLELRLQHSASCLARPGGGGRKVSDIAFASGFSDLSYFYRCFRRRFGMTPSGVRAA